MAPPKATKATRPATTPGSSNGGTAVASPAKRKTPSEFTANRLHPVQVEYTYPVGTRLDIDRKLPFDLGQEDPVDLLDLLSTPAEYVERIAPLSATFNLETISAKSPADMQSKLLRNLVKNLAKVGGVMAQACKMSFAESGAVAFMGLGLDPDTISRMIEFDYETADNIYSRLCDLIEKGIMTPVVTTPFHTMLPLYQHEFEIRLLVRIALEVYWPLLKKYNRAVAKNLGEKLFTAVFWLPEGAFCTKVLQVVHQEFTKRCEEEKISPCHLVILLDSEQSREREHDLLMKRWNTLRPSPTTRDIVSVLFKERGFSDWVVDGHPSTKKQLDRTIAKVDAVLRDTGKDHLWSHFEPLETLLSTFKTCNNFEQKMIKLTELGYQPCGPDVFVRRKMLKLYGMEENEPRRTTLRDMTCWSGYADSDATFLRFRGLEDPPMPGGTPKLASPRPYTRRLPDGRTKAEDGNPCWKPALLATLQAVHRAVVGDPKTFMGGLLGLLSSLMPTRRVPIIMRNIEAFLVRYARVQWKEHFIQHVCSEADIQLSEFCNETLLHDIPDVEDPELSDEAMVTAAVAASAIYHAHMGLCCAALAPEHIDQRHTYENVAMLTLAVSEAIHALRWNGKTAEANALFDIYKREFLDFKGAYTRHGIDKLGVDKATWERTIASQVADTPLNVVERAARRVGATHLRKAGYRDQFAQGDESTPTSVGHLWSTEIDHLNYKWENELFCGLAEE